MEGTGGGGESAREIFEMGARSGERNTKVHSEGRVQEEQAESESGKESGKVRGQNGQKGRVQDTDYWKAAWQDVDIFNKNLIEDPTKQIPGFDLPRKIWCKLNRFRTGHGKCNNTSMLFHWNIRENPSCECGAEKETIQHIVEEYPLTKFQQSFSKLHLLTEDTLNWLQQIKNI
jgi:hypothetical protein